MVERKRSRSAVQVAEAHIDVYSSYAGSMRQERKVISVQKFESEPAFVRVSKGSTHNMGTYESLRVDVSVTMPCYPEEVEALVPDLFDLVSVLLDDETTEKMKLPQVGDGGSRD